MLQSNKYTCNTVLYSFVYYMNGFGNIVLILVSFFRYWNGLHVHVKTFVLSLLLQFLCNMDVY